ncbi:hypothetical protein [Alteribacillus sp. HJP-4]|uniref:hypothetical protein n=1 Tax=Alteribacillus sp. HJP-4 TaxID=2775394 RepID=UPI0035CCEBAF
MNPRENECKACDGTGLLMDDEQWRYSCSVCGGDGIFNKGDSPEPDKPFDTDENKRTLE